MSSLRYQKLPLEGAESASENIKQLQKNNQKLGESIEDLFANPF